MKKILSLCLTIIFLASVLPVCVQAAQSPILWDFEELNAAENWKVHLADGQDWEEHFSFSVENKDENSFGLFKYTNPLPGTVVRYKRDFESAVELPQDGYLVISCRVKLSGDSVGTYQLRAFNASDKQEILMGFGNKVSIYESHNPITLNSPIYCDSGFWHDVEIILSGRDKAMLHYFDGKPVSGEWVPLYTYADESQFAGPYNNLQIVSYGDNSSGTQEFMIDDISVYSPEAGALVASTPLQGSRAADPTEPITLTFNRYIDEESLNLATVTINGDKAGISLDNTDRKTCLITPTQSLAADTEYQVSVAGLKDILGADLSATVNFKTRSGIYVKNMNITETDTSGNVRDITEASLLGGDITAEITLDNNVGKKDSVAAVFALYDGEQLVRCHMTDITEISSAETEKKVTLGFSVTQQEAQNNTLRLFVLSMSDLSPLMTAWQSRSAYFVSPDGSDANVGSAESPFKTLARAVRSTQAGDTVIFEDGEYTETEIVTFTNGGTEAAPIVLTARNKGEAKITFKSSENEKLRKREKINIPHSSGGYVTIKDLILTQDEAANADDNTTIDIFINCRADNCSFIGNEIYNCYEEPIKAAGVSNILVADNILHSSVHEGIDFVNVSDSTVRGNTISEIERIAVMVKGGSRNIKVYNNTVYNETKSMDVALSIGGSTDNYSGLGSSEEFFEGYNQYFWNNVVYVSGTGSIDTAILFQGSKDSMAFNNTLSGSNYGIRLTNAPGLANDWEWDPTNVNPKLYNNLIVNAKTYGVYESSTAENLVSDYNWFSNCATASEVDGVLSFTTTDPGLVNPAAGDFRIKSDSPLSGEGCVLSNTVSGYNGTSLKLDLEDKNGVSRGSKWAIGAYQPIK